MSHLPATRRPNVLMPDEYLPPNKILFLQNLPETVSKDQLTALFSQCVSFRICIIAPPQHLHTPARTLFGFADSMT